jgi:hypothetical protein
MRDEQDSRQVWSAAPLLVQKQEYGSRSNQTMTPE